MPPLKPTFYASKYTQVIEITPPLNSLVLSWVVKFDTSPKGLFVNIFGWSPLFSCQSAFWKHMHREKNPEFRPRRCILQNMHNSAAVILSSSIPPSTILWWECTRDAQGVDESRRDRNSRLKAGCVFCSSFSPPPISHSFQMRFWGIDACVSGSPMKCLPSKPQKHGETWSHKKVGVK